MADPGAYRGKFRKLMEPSQIGRVPTRNRMIKTASGTALIEDDGTVGERMKFFYKAMAKGGVGLIVFENCSVEWPRGTVRVRSSVHLENDKYIPSFKELTEVVHRQGCPIFMQLMHYGARFKANQGVEPGDRVSASTLTEDELPEGGDYVVPRSLSTAEVGDLIDKFAKASERSQKAGFDGVEINGSHNHLINTFLSRFWNRRQDAYGCGSLENRARFMVEIIREVKRRCGKDYPVTALINGAEYGLKNGTTVEEAKRFAQLLQEAGADAIHVRAEGYGEFSGMLFVDRFFYPELPKNLMVKEFDWSHKGRGFSVPLGATIKEAVSIPVYVSGRLDPEIGEEVLRQGKLDFIGMTRRLLADPELPNKVAAGKLEDVAPCAGCLYCWPTPGPAKPVACRINAALGKGEEYEIRPAEKKKRVLIVGGGPAGMEAARVAALRGHQVILYEKENKVGGSLPLASIVKDVESENILNTIRYLKNQMTKLGVTINLGKEVNLSAIKEINPDVVILATGGVPTIPSIPGISNRKVANSAELHNSLKRALRLLGPKAIQWLTKLWMPVGKRVVIIGGALQGCQLAEFLVKRGRKVAIVDSAEQLGEGLLADDPARLFKWLNRKGVRMMAGIKYEGITDEGLVVITKEGEKKTLEADTVITALPLLPTAELLKVLEGKVPEIYQIGDCRESGFIADAIADGSRVARRI